MLSYIIKEKGNIKKAYKMYKASKKIKQLDLFDPDYYLKKYPDVKKSGMNPLHHYLYHGYKEKKQPGKLFDTNFYLKDNPDVKKSGENPLVHYVLHGRREGRDPVKNKNAEIRKLKREVAKLQRKSDNNFSILQSYNKLFNDLYIYHETTPKGPLKYMQELCMELLIFFDNVCTKHDIEYWLDYGTLLGPVRHQGFLPWDDDVDLGMLKNDFEKLMKVMKEEIKSHGYENDIEILEKKKYDDTVTGFIQIIYRSPVERYMLACIDILPYEFLKNDENLEKADLKTKISEQIKVTREEFLENEYFKKSPVEANEKLNEIVGIVPHKAAYIIPAAVNLKPRNIRIYKYEEMYPLQRIQFGEKKFLAAREEREYLKMTYGEGYMSMPKKIKIHTRIPSLIRRHKGDIQELYQKELDKIRDTNENFN